MFSLSQRRPFGLRWRSSVWFTTLVVGFGIAIDILVYSTVVPVFPFRFEELGYPVSGISALIGWMLFAYSAGIVIFSVPFALLSEHYANRKIPMMLGYIALVGSQVMLMLSPTYWLLIIARVLQGASSSVVWVIGLALLSDVTPEKKIGSQLGIAMIGISVGVILGPPIGGVLYDRLGFLAPFIFGIITTMVDLLGRLLIVERKDALKYGHDPSAIVLEGENEQTQNGSNEKSPGVNVSQQDPSSAKSLAPVEGEPVTRQLPVLQVFRLMLSAPRALVALLISLLYGVIYSGAETVLPLRLQSEFGYDSEAVGIIFLAAVVPSLFSSPAAGWLTDRYGAEWVTTGCLLLALPWWIAIAFRLPFATFMVIFTFQYLFVGGILSPVTVELTVVARRTPGVGYGHIYAAFNVAYGLGTAFGPLIFGQIYAHTSSGWLAMNMISSGLIVILVLLSLIFTGDRPIIGRFFKRSSSTVTEESSLP